MSRDSSLEPIHRTIDDPPFHLTHALLAHRSQPEQRTLRAEVERSWSPEHAAEETQRSWLCHPEFELAPEKCILCDWCIRVKPHTRCIVAVSQRIYDEPDRIRGFQEARSTENTPLIRVQQSECIRCRGRVDACSVAAIGIQKVSRVTRVDP